MKVSFGIGTIQLVFKDLPLIARHYINLAKTTDDGSFNTALGGPVTRITSPDEVAAILAVQPDSFKEHPASKDHYEVCYFNNNSGGPTYVIPKDFVAPFLVDAIQHQLGA
jgi:hypothetical protein